MHGGKRRNVVRSGRGERLFRILALDGGGMRGIIPGEVLAYVEERTRRPVHALFDLVAGTSAGGLLGLALTVPRPGRAEPWAAADALDVFRRDGPRIFSRGPV